MTDATLAIDQGATIVQYTTASTQINGACALFTKPPDTVGSGTAH